MERDGKTAVVTGASMGIGRGIALTLAEKGYDLFITHLNEAGKANEVAETIRNVHGRRCAVMQIDLTHADAPGKVIEQAAEEMGAVDVLVNNAGASLFEAIPELSLEQLDYLLHLNFRAPLLAMKFVSAHMIERGIRGSIVSVASSRAERAYPHDAVYGGLKAALVRATQSAALDLAPHGIRVNTVAPGAIQVRDEMETFYRELGAKIPMGRAGTPADIGQAVAWLVSAEAAYVTGINLRVDGGLILPGMPERTDSAPGRGRV